MSLRSVSYLVSPISSNPSSHPHQLMPSAMIWIVSRAVMKWDIIFPLKILIELTDRIGVDLSKPLVW